jgi:hypothetical protein
MVEVVFHRALLNYALCQLQLSVAVDSSNSLEIIERSRTLTSLETIYICVD